MRLSSLPVHSFAVTSPMASLILSPSLPTSCSPAIPTITPSPRRAPSSFLFISSGRHAVAGARLLATTFALVESNTSSSRDEEEPILPLLQELSDCLYLPLDFLSKLPGDLRLDVRSFAFRAPCMLEFAISNFFWALLLPFLLPFSLKLNDAAFDLANGPVLDECGKEVGDLFLNLSRAWEQADTMTSNSIASKLPSLHGYLTSDVKPAIGKRLLSVGRRFEAMGQYEQGELQRISRAMIKIGKLLSTGPVIQTEKSPKKETKIFKFGELQVALTREKANIGAAIAFAFGFLSWELSQGIQNVTESSFQYANDNALMLAKSLRGSLLLIAYSSTLLSAFACVGLLLLGRQLSSEKSKEP